MAELSLFWSNLSPIYSYRNCWCQWPLRIRWPYSRAPDPISQQYRQALIWALPFRPSPWSESLWDFSCELPLVDRRNVQGTWVPPSAFLPFPSTAQPSSSSSDQSTADMGWGFRRHSWFHRTAQSPAWSGLDLKWTRGRSSPRTC